MQSFQFEIGPVRAQGVPAILAGVTGIVVGAGICQALAKSSERLPETLREARALAQTLRSEKPQLNA